MTYTRMRRISDMSDMRTMAAMIPAIKPEICRDERPSSLLSSSGSIDGLTATDWDIVVIGGEGWD